MNELDVEKKTNLGEIIDAHAKCGESSNLLAMSREWNAVQQARAQQETGKFPTRSIVRQDPSHGRRHNGVA